MKRRWMELVVVLAMVAVGILLSWRPEPKPMGIGAGDVTGVVWVLTGSSGEEYRFQAEPSHYDASYATWGPRIGRAGPLSEGEFRRLVEALLACRLERLGVEEPPAADSWPTMELVLETGDTSTRWRTYVRPLRGEWHGLWRACSAELPGALLRALEADRARTASQSD